MSAWCSAWTEFDLDEYETSIVARLSLLHRWSEGVEGLLIRKPTRPFRNMHCSRISHAVKEDVKSTICLNSCVANLCSLLGHIEVLWCRKIDNA